MLSPLSHTSQDPIFTLGKDTVHAVNILIGAGKGGRHQWPTVRSHPAGPQAEITQAPPLGDAALCGSSFVFSILAPDCLWEVPPFTPMPLAPAQVGVEELRVLSGGSVALKPAGHAVQLGVGFRLEVSTALSGSQFRLARGLVGNIMSFS